MFKNLYCIVDETNIKFLHPYNRFSFDLFFTKQIFLQRYYIFKKVFGLLVAMVEKLFSPIKALKSKTNLRSLVFVSTI